MCLSVEIFNILFSPSLNVKGKFTVVSVSFNWYQSQLLSSGLANLKEAFGEHTLRWVESNSEMFLSLMEQIISLEQTDVCLLNISWI